MNVTKPAGNLYYTSGNMFVAPGQQTWDLVDLKIVGGDCSSDTISFLQDNYAKVDSSKVFYYISEDEAGDESEIGWWYVGGVHEGEKVESYPVPAGVGFLCRFVNEDTKITYAGEVIKGQKGEITIERADNQLYRFVANPNPGRVDLTSIKIVGGSCSDDTFSFLQSNYAKVDANKVFYYISEDEAGDESEIGWWYVGGIHEGDKVEEKQVFLEAGDAFLAYMIVDGSKIVFPAPAL